MHTFILFIPLLLNFAQGQLDELAKAAGLKYFGVAIDNPDFSFSEYIEIASNTAEFGQITPGNPQKFAAVEPYQGVFSFSEAEVVTDFANKNGQMLRCHNLLWYLWLPEWVSDGSWTKDSLTAALKDHITTEVTRFRGQCYAWDVVNEAIDTDGTMRKTVWTDIIGDDFIRIAFETAAAADPHAKLYYNDYEIEIPGPKRDGVVRLIRTLQASGTRIDGVGLQSHFTVGQTPSKEAQIANMEVFTALGIEVAITELDIISKLPVTAADEVQQSTDYENTVAACVAVKDCVGVTMWGFGDARSWLNIPGSDEGDPCIFDADLNRKLAYFGVVAGLSGSPGQGVTSQSSSTTSSQGQIPSTYPPAGVSTSTYGQIPSSTYLPAGTSTSDSGQPNSLGSGASGGASTSSSSPASSATTSTVFTLVNITTSTTFSTIASPTSLTTHGPYSFSNLTTSPTLIAGCNAGTVRATGISSAHHHYHYHSHYHHGHPSSTAISMGDDSSTTTAGVSATLSVADASTTSVADTSITSVAGFVHDPGCRCPQCLGT